MTDTPKLNIETDRTIAAADLTHVDTETDRMLRIVIEIPFYGRKAQAEKFITETLGRILAVGIGSHVKIREYKITTP